MYQPLSIPSFSVLDLPFMFWKQKGWVKKRKMINCVGSLMQYGSFDLVTAGQCMYVVLQSTLKSYYTRVFFIKCPLQRNRWDRSYICYLYEGRGIIIFTKSFLHCTFEMLVFHSVSMPCTYSTVRCLTQQHVSIIDNYCFLVNYFQKK